MNSTIRVSKLALFAVSVSVATLAVAQDGAETRAVQAKQELSNFRLSVGLDYSEGDYGDVVKTQVSAIPVALKYAKGPLSIRVSSSFVHVRGTGSLQTTPEDRPGRTANDDGGGSPAFLASSNSGQGSANSGSGSSGSSGGGGSSGSGGSGSSGGGSGGSSGSSGSGGSGSSGGGSSGSSGGGGSGSSGSGGSGSSSGGSGASGGGGSASGTGSTTTAAVAGGSIIPGGANRSQSGIGDTNVSLTYSIDLGADTYLDVTGKVKIPTASTARRLGTGKVDFVAAAELSKSFGAFDVYVGGHRRFVGRNATGTNRSTWGASGGAGVRVAKGVRFGVDYDWQQASFAGGTPSSEISAAVNIKLSRRLNLNIYALTGTNVSSADFGSGAQLTYRF